MMRRILYTRPDRGVSICTPSLRCLRTMATGGRWPDMPRGFIDTQIERQIANGIDADVAARFTRALAFGGMSEPEAFDTIRRRDCRDGLAHEIITAADLPDRWFRNAWRRSHNGGPIVIDLEAARPIQWAHLRRQASERQAEANRDYRRAGEVIAWDWRGLGAAIARARDEDELRAVTLMEAA